MSKENGNSPSYTPTPHNCRLFDCRHAKPCYCYFAGFALGKDKTYGRWRTSSLISLHGEDCYCTECETVRAIIEDIVLARVRHRIAIVSWRNGKGGVNGELLRKVDRGADG